MSDARDQKGRWQPGHSPNPSGRPKALIEVIELARKHTPEAIAALASIMNNKEAMDSARVKAAEVLLDRGWGKAPQHITIDDQPAETSLADTELGGRLDILARKALRERSGGLGGTLATEVPSKSSSVVH